ncbi:MAG: FixH family protein [Pacificimonas sp.]|jgi:nitrogen fixation protein FixH|nr:FixH family protein [Pacificimonas sp.]
MSIARNASTAPAAKGRTLTGRRVALIFVAFFGSVIAVNMFMAFMASGTFGGTVVDNSYVASQRYNDWLAEARADEALGWQVEHRHDGERLVIRASSAGQVLSGVHIEAEARPPVGTEAAHPLTFSPLGDGSFAAPLAPGRWQVRMTITDGENSRRLLLRLS